MSTLPKRVARGTCATHRWGLNAEGKCTLCDLGVKPREFAPLAVRRLPEPARSDPRPLYGFVAVNAVGVAAAVLWMVGVI